VIPQIVLDTNVVVAAMRSRRGASFALLNLVGKDFYDFHLSVPLVMEYRDVLARFVGKSGYDAADVDAILNDLCKLGHLHGIYFLWRPFLPDIKDDLLLELAVAARADFIVTHNVRHFPGLAPFGFRAVTPLQFLMHIGGRQ
jgi:predicted nucleic acid-binding protein